MRRVVLAGCALSLAIGAVTALSVSCTEPELSPFGNPNTLDRKNLPGEGGVEALVCTGEGEGGAGGGFDGGCPSFATDIFPYFTAGGTWRCADGACHAPGATAPPIVETSAAECLASLKQIQVAKIPYVSSDGGKDPNAQSLLCNLQGSCGSKMPKPPGADPTTADLCKIEAWLKCGAPP
ncbi:MAG: hypothetical protein KF819_24025 [Labilithrix sp.]|nr:hypothetical protein [Labilithrix sp.]